MKKRSILVITDGLGHRSESKYNAFSNAKTPFYDFLFKNIPYSYIKTSGEAIGLPKGVMGNSEVGHMTIGSGRVIEQNLVRLNRLLDSDKIQSNTAFKLLKNSRTVHLLGLCSDGCVHSNLNHLFKLIDLLDDGKKIWIHLISDGRDVMPKSVKKYLNLIESKCNVNVKIATISGRFYSMDRDNRWDRILKSYNSIVNASNGHSSTIDYVNSSYNNGVTDEFIIPASFNGYKGMSKNDYVCFFNYRNDRARELSMAIACDNFKHFSRKSVFKNFITMTEYDITFGFSTILQKHVINNHLSEVISKEGLLQMHIAETEKYAHVTFFFNGGVEIPYKNESRIVVKSKNVDSYDLVPQMSAIEVRDKVLDSLSFEYDFIVVNFANPDMVGHTGNYEASIKAVETVDSVVESLYKKAKSLDYSFILTSDHGNVEELKDKDGKTLTNHTHYDVYLFIDSPEVNKVENGSLVNIAPTILKTMGINIPKEMSKPLF